MQFDIYLIFLFAVAYFLYFLVFSLAWMAFVRSN